MLFLTESDRKLGGAWEASFSGPCAWKPWNEAAFTYCSDNHSSFILGCACIHCVGGTVRHVQTSGGRVEVLPSLHP